MTDTAALRVGCSGWQYAHWRGDFYPAELPVETFLKALRKVAGNLGIKAGHVLEFREPYRGGPVRVRP